MPAEIAVNSTAEKIQSSIFLKYIYIHMCIHRYHGTQGPGAVAETTYIQPLMFGYEQLDGWGVCDQTRAIAW